MSDFQMMGHISIQYLLDQLDIESKNSLLTWNLKKLNTPLKPYLLLDCMEKIAEND